MDRLFFFICGLMLLLGMAIYIGLFVFIGKVICDVIKFFN